MIYVASNAKHIPMWRRFKENGYQILTTCLDGYDNGPYGHVAKQRMADACSASALILYCEHDEVLDNALLEAGAALAFRVRVFCVGRCVSLTDACIYTQHYYWTDCANIGEALKLATDQIPCSKCGMVRC